MEELSNALSIFENAAAASRNEQLILQLYIAGSSARSQRAVINVRRICTESLSGACELQVIDILQQPSLAKTEQIFAVPTLVKKYPNPKRFFIGDMSDTTTILACLNA